MRKGRRFNTYSSISPAKVSRTPVILGVYKTKTAANRAKNNALSTIRKSARSLSVKPGVVKGTAVLRIKPAMPRNVD